MMVEFLLDIQEIRRPESVYTLSANWWSSIKDLKDKIFSLTHEPPSRQHIFHSTNPVELHNSQILHDLGIEKSGRMLRVAIDYRSRAEFTLTPTKGVLIDESCKEMLQNVRLGLQRNLKPKATDEFEGSGGVYFLKSPSGSYEAVFKPHDEEQGMPCNPKDHVGVGKEGLREHFQPGQGCLRELAAYIMDHQNFCRVPPTTLVHCEHRAFHYPAPLTKVGSGQPYPKLGSLQKFIHNAELFEDVGPSLLSDIEVQKIALLDMRILNCDRNAANILVKFVSEVDCVLQKDEDDDHISFLPQCESDCEMVPSNSAESSPQSGRKGESVNKTSGYQLYPIDHGYVMPSRLRIFEWDWAWLYYPQVDRPAAPEIINYLESLNIDDLLQKLEPQVPLSDDSVFLLRLSHYLLVEGVRAGLTLKDIALLIARSDEEVASKLELFIEEAEENAYRSIELKSSSRVKGTVNSLLSTSPRSTTSVSSSPRSNVRSDLSNEDHKAGDISDLEKVMCNQNGNYGTNYCKCNAKKDHSLQSSSSDETTHESDTSSLDRSSPPIARENCHAIDLSPMRPHLSSSSSWNSFSSFHVSQPSLHNYAVKSRDCDNSLGMSPSKKKAISRYLAREDQSTNTIKPPGLAAVKLPGGQNIENMSLFIDESKGPNEEGRLDTIVENARERGLSSLSNCSTTSRDSDSCYFVGQDDSTISIAETKAGSSYSSIVTQSQAIALNDTESSKNCSELSALYLDVDAINSNDEVKHMSLPGNALRRMNAINTAAYPISVKSSSSDCKTTQILPQGIQYQNNDVGSKYEENQSCDFINGIHVDLGQPLLRAQVSIDSSLEPAILGHGKSNLGSSAKSCLTKTALYGSYLSRGCDTPPTLEQFSRRLNGNNSANSISPLEDLGSDYGFFSSVKDGSDVNSGDSPQSLKCGEFSGIDLPSIDGEDGEGSYNELCAPISLSRVVSFSGFESAPVYSNIFAGKMGNLRLERRKGIAKTTEFMQLRLQFALEHISSFIQRMKPSKTSTVL